ncbi:MAG: DUF1440 domain-containing protein [Actinomycetota bacterium]|nr:DUF1440 domain-containing protein [Actinomycetota bacterium]
MPQAADERIRITSEPTPMDTGGAGPGIGGAGGDEVVHAIARGIVGAMAMSGIRVVMQHGGLIKRTPPQAIARERARGLMRIVPRKRRPVIVELLHWGVGAMGGAVFGMLPESMRRVRWAGPAFGVAILLSYEFGIAPLMGLSHAKRWSTRERAAFLADHLVYGLVLNEGRERPNE